MNPIPPECPSCGGSLVAPVAVCGACGVEVQGEFEPCAVCRLEEKDRRLFDLFLSSRGNLKRMERELKVSYPTVRLRVDGLLTRMGYLRTDPPDRLEVLKRLKEGKISVEEAERLLRG
jgi:hypothetical protein